MVKHTQIIRRLLSTDCLSVFDHFVGLALKGLKTLFFFNFELNLKILKQKQNTSESESFRVF